jgi:hypothetical protein
MNSLELLVPQKRKVANIMDLDKDPSLPKTWEGF